MKSNQPEHPDLAQFERLARRRFDEVAEYEQEAAMLQVQRMSTLRDRLLDAEDAELTIRIWAQGGHLCEGTPFAVGQDHVELGDSRQLIIPFSAIEMVEFT
ncbi:MAG: hypothetical protein OXN80_03220 [bacterium]|nr:hypothetical protein [bacterium]MDE0501603.1 hypothetical protein [bacterium]